MTTVKASCPTCGELVLQPAQLSCVEIVDGLGWYAFTCTVCGDVICKPAPDHVVTLLRSGDVRVVTTTIPAEAHEVHRGAALTSSDAADFRLDLAVWDGVLSQDLA